MPNLQALDATSAPFFMGASSDGDGSNIMIRTSEHRKATFKYAGTFTPVAAPTDAIIIKGSPTSTLRIKQIKLGGLCTTAGVMPVTLIRRSTANSGGTAVLNAVSAGKLDTGDAAPGGVVSTVGTGNFSSLGASANNIGQGRMFLNLVTAAPQQLTWEFATRQDKALILRGVLDFLCINFAGAAVPAGGVIDYDIEIEEDAS